jgi:hypothetical protein
LGVVYDGDEGQLTASVSDESSENITLSLYTETKLQPGQTIKIKR